MGVDKNYVCPAKIHDVSRLAPLFIGPAVMVVVVLTGVTFFPTSSRDIMNKF